MILLQLPLILKNIYNNIIPVIILTKIKKFYNSLGHKTRIVINCTLALSLPLLFISVFSSYAYFTPFQYELLIISDELSATARSILSTGFIGAFLFNYLEKTE